MLKVIIIVFIDLNSNKLGDDSANPGVRVDEDEEEKE